MFLNRYTARDIEEAPDTRPRFPIGEIHAQIIDVRLGNTKSGVEMIIVTFDNFDGAEISDYIVDNEWAARKLKNLMSSFRIPFYLYNRFQEWIGHEGHVVTKEGEPYEGKVYPKVSHYRSIKVTGAEPVTEYHDDISF